MRDRSERRPASEVARWHKLSGMPDNVTEEGLVVPTSYAQRLRTEKALLRAAIDNLKRANLPTEVLSLARLAAGYLLAGDAETARRYVTAAQAALDRLQAGNAENSGQDR